MQHRTPKMGKKNTIGSQPYSRTHFREGKHAKKLQKLIKIPRLQTAQAYECTTQNNILMVNIVMGKYQGIKFEPYFVC